MLFNSFEFIAVFLPLTLAVFFVLGHLASRRVAIAWLVFASLFFYGWWRPEYVLLLAGSIVFNFWLGNRLADGAGRAVLIFAVAVNLALLGYFKYTIFVLDSFNLLTGAEITLPAIVLPLAISFFTFQQIAYLADAHFGIARERSFPEYCLFVCFFPQLIAGPIVHHREMLPQFQRAATFRPKAENIAVGATIFAIGLFKKAVVADGIAVYADAAFNAAGGGEPLTVLAAWGGAIAFTLQIYFDFSGYTDMAIGLARMFGIRLPLNFNSPYKAASIIDFWARWHMTLTRFLTAYVYNPVAMSLTRRRIAQGKGAPGKGRFDAGSFAAVVALPTVLTMFLAGVWHGAGFQFMVYGLLHGAYLVVNHGWRAVCKGTVLGRPHVARALRPMYFLLTFVAVVVSLTVFRAQSTDQAVEMLRGMAGLNGLVLPNLALAVLGERLAGLLAFVSFGDVPYFSAQQWFWLALLLAFVWLLPNTQEWLARYGTGTRAVRRDSWVGLGRLLVADRWLGAWRPSMTCGVFVGGVLCFALMQALSQTPAEFVYFRF